MDKRKIAVIAMSCVGVFVIAALATGGIYKMNKTAEYEALLTQQQEEMEQAKQAAARKAAEEKLKAAEIELPAIKPLEEKAPEVVEAPKEETPAPPAPPVATSKPKAAAKKSTPPKVTVSTDAGGNQTITEEYKKPDPPKHEDILDPETPPPTPPSTPSKPGGKVEQEVKDENVQFDGNGDQKPNASGEVFVPGFGWMKPSGSKGETLENMNPNGNIVGE